MARKMHLLGTPASLSSEEWISQPRSSAEASPDGQSFGSGGSVRPTSRIPRLKTSPSANSSPQSEQLLRQPNAANGQQFIRLTKSKALQDFQRKLSNSSRGSAEHGTIQHQKIVGPIDTTQPTRVTPFWKRRMLEAADATGKQQDLFSPIGLENVFRPPNADLNLPKQALYRYAPKADQVDVSVFPSSPPLYPPAVSASPSLNPSDILQDKSQRIRTESIVDGSSVLVRKLEHSQLLDRKLNANSPRSSQSDSQNEKISPVQVPDTQVDYRSLDETLTKLRANIHDCEVNRQISRSSFSSDRETDYVGSTKKLQHINVLSSDWTSQSLPDDLSVSTDLFAAKGGFVNLYRGGHSADGSFRRRSLSPSSFRQQDGFESDAQSQRNLSQPKSSSSDHQNIKYEQLDRLVARSAFGTQTPSKDGSIGSGNIDQPKPSGSPLKLFDKYDTFTNDRLLRRMSQFQGSTADSCQNSVTARRGDSRSPSNLQHPMHDEQHQSLNMPITWRAARYSSFGEGSLDGHSFTHQPPAQEAQSAVSFGTIKDQLVQRAERLYHSRLETASPTEGFEGIQNGGGKRFFLNSPIKYPNPKRRRTLCSATGAPDTSIILKHQTQALPQTFGSSRKRKDAKYGDTNQIADPETIATRHMLWPKIPATSQMRNNRRYASVECFPSGNEAEHDDNQRALDEMPVQALAGQLANFAIDVAQDITDGERKISVTTADFTNVAQLIMQNIRAQARPRSGVSNGEHLEEDQLITIAESTNEDSTVEEFSRPPSREGGGSIRRLREPRQLDPRVVSHLRKFEEKGEIDIILPSLPHPPVMPHEPSEGHQSVESDPPNIRIRGDSRSQSDKERSDSSAPSRVSAPSDNQSHSSQSSFGQCTGASVYTGSSGSGNKAVIAPDLVSHLISESIAGMTFDRSKRVWVRKKGAENLKDDDLRRVGSDGTEDDPLAEIPDLSVDEAEEMKRTNDAAAVLQHIPSHIVKNLTASGRVNSAQGVTQDTSALQYANVVDCTLNTKTSTLPNTSVPDIAKMDGPLTLPERTLNKSAISLMMPEPAELISSHNKEEEPEEVEHEISILEGRNVHTLEASKRQSRQPRVVTVAFSSPLLNNAREAFYSNIDDEEDMSEDELDVPMYASNRYGAISKPKLLHHGCLTKMSRPKYGGRRMSLDREKGASRAISTIDELDETAFHGCKRMSASAAMEIEISTPQPTQRLSRESSVALAHPEKSSCYAFDLTPLSDFTMQHIDNPTGVEKYRTAHRRGFLSCEEVEGQFSLSIKELVKNITDIEPYEPYWDYIRKLDLRNKGLLSLQMLDDFCPRVEQLDLSGNKLCQLAGAPMSIRTLIARENSLSNLTAWDHLHNLQYLDVSSNRLQSLGGLKTLIHLRELIADDNSIEELFGIADLSGLLKLRVRRNSLRDVSFQGFHLIRLLELDLEGNQIRKVVALNQLPALSLLNLRDNEIHTVTEDLVATVPSLISLNISKNRMSGLDVTYFPSIRTLNIDQNCLARINGLDRAQNIETICWREQKLEQPVNEAPISFANCCEASTLRLSGNKIPTFAPSIPFLGLRYLELACTGLVFLPTAFGLGLPNLRVLNLNNNALKDLRPVIGISRLQELYVAGNRISKLRRTTAVLGRIGNDLRIFDCRANLMTVGFYPPLQTSEARNQQQLVLRKKEGVARPLDINRHDNTAISAYLIPEADNEADKCHVQNLDDSTAMRRRVYEMLILSRCKKLHSLDGLRATRDVVGDKDRVFRRLLELGVLKERQSGWGNTK